MVHPTPFPIDKTRLRSVAEANLEQGTAPPNGGWALNPDALALLYKLASTPDNAGDGLKLLHELQTHQVELDLQHAQIEANERESDRERARYKAFYDFAPVGYLVVDCHGRIVESNHAGAELLGSGQHAIGGRPVGDFLASESRPTLDALLTRLHRDGRRSACEVQSADNGGRSQRLRITANLAPDRETVLMAVSESDPAPGL